MLLDRKVAEGLPLLPLKSITPFPLGSLETAPGVWLVVKMHNSCIHCNLVIDRHTEKESFMGGLCAAELIVPSTSAGKLGGSVTGLIVAWPLLSRVDYLITLLLIVLLSEELMLIATKGETCFPHKAYLWKKKKIKNKEKKRGALKMFSSSSVTEKTCKV